MRAVPLVTGAFPDGPAWGFPYHRGARRGTEKPITSAQQAVETASADACELVDTLGQVLIKIICVLSCHSIQWSFALANPPQNSWLVSHPLCRTIMGIQPCRGSCSKHWRVRTKKEKYSRPASVTETGSWFSLCLLVLCMLQHGWKR